MNLVDASAMPWRLHLRGVAVGARFEAIADRWAGVGGGAGQYAFNDLHAIIAFVGADRSPLQQQLLDARQAAMQSDADDAAFTREVGHAAARSASAAVTRNAT
jgi:hypothetical protein